jgi:hypothetical protein
MSGSAWKAVVEVLALAERTELAIAILRSSIIKVSRLEISTAENLAYIPVGRMAILREIYRVAKEDERMRETGDRE